MNKKLLITQFSEKLLPLNGLEELDNDKMYIVGGNYDVKPTGVGCGCTTGVGCGCACSTGSGCGCNCTTGSGCGCGCSIGSGCGCNC